MQIAAAAGVPIPAAAGRFGHGYSTPASSPEPIRRVKLSLVDTCGLSGRLA